ncbi:MAG TPA: hypothetical protein VFD71_13215 [Planctomycetota bacterium]|nr:hypothetical protein [Planctomycetota bacterium]
MRTTSSHRVGRRITTPAINSRPAAVTQPTSACYGTGGFRGAARIGESAPWGSSIEQPDEARRALVERAAAPAF